VVDRSAVAGDEGETPEVKTATVFAALATIAVALVPPAGARKDTSRLADRATVAKLAILLDRIAEHRDETWHWQRIMLRPRTPYAASAIAIRSVAYRTWVMQLWLRRALAAKRQATNPPHKREWLCIHRYEARWTDPDGPYYGGLQMDLEFQATYGARLLRSKGTAEHWTPLEQMWVAERALKTRGFWPWPNTARACGLI
jgi:hypothetical protein